MRGKLKSLLKKIMLLLYHMEIKLFPVKKNVVLFESNVGRNYAGNVRAIYEESVKRGLDQTLRCYYVFEDIKTAIPGGAMKIKRLGFRYFYILARAGVWVSDTRFPLFVVKREQNTYIQTWHGTPLKKLALDMEQVFMDGESDLRQYKENFCVSSRTWDYLVSQNAFSTEIFRRAFAYDKQILEIGYPRNDCLIRPSHPEVSADRKAKMGLPAGKKIILYAPTWRDDEYYGHGRYKFNPHLDFRAMMEALSDQYVMLVKYHYLVQDLVDWSPYRGFIYEFDQGCEISDLYLAADLLITDYSSVMFDYSLLRRPMFFYAYDLAKYKNNLRGFYFDFEQEAPGPISLTSEKLIRDILDYDMVVYDEKYRKFMEKYNHADDGRASEKITGLIERLAAE